MKIAVIGAGYVGLPLAAVLADLGHRVWIVRKDKEKNEALKKGIVHIIEPGLEKLVKKNLKARRFIPTTEYSEAIPEAEVIFSTVGTPSKSSGEADLSSIFEVAKEIGQNLKKKATTIIVNKSTAPPGTSRKMAAIIEKSKNPQAAFEMAFCPEFLREGFAIQDTLHADRAVIGAENAEAIRILKAIHRPLAGQILVTGIESAEMIKYAANTYLALRIVYVNQLADLCEKSGADISQVIQGMGLDKRIGLHYWYPGLGYGGSCFPKDVEAIAHFARKKGEKGSLFEKTHKLNLKRIEEVLKKMEKQTGSFVGKKIGVLGLACKQGTDDVRESPAIKVIQALRRKKAKIQAYDPLAIKNAQKVLSGVKFCSQPYPVCQGAKMLLILTDWPQFAQLDYVKIKRLMQGNFIFDSRNLLDGEKMRQLGFVYLGIGGK